MKRLFWIIPRLKGAAGPQPDPRGDDREPEMELVSIPSVTEVSKITLFDILVLIYMHSKCRDPLHVLLEYIATVSGADMPYFHYVTTLILTWNGAAGSRL